MGIEKKQRRNVGKLPVHKNGVNILHQNGFYLKTDSKSKKLADQDLQCALSGNVGMSQNDLRGIIVPYG